METQLCKLIQSSTIRIKMQSYTFVTHQENGTIYGKLISNVPVIINK